jgi:glutathione peroxidase
MLAAAASTRQAVPTTRRRSAVIRHGSDNIVQPEQRKPAMAAPSVYDFEALSIAGKPAELAAQRGKVLLIVNTASACGFTPQFAGLETLWRQYRDKGLVVVGFPSNQFGAQDPGSNDEIASFCQLNYGVSFPMMAKVDVNGTQAHPLWKWLTAEAPGILGSKAIKWNFTKFLVGKDGQVIKRYAPNDKPESLAADIEAALAA